MATTRPKTPAARTKHKTVRATLMVSSVVEAKIAVPKPKTPTEMAFEMTRKAAWARDTSSREMIT